MSARGERDDATPVIPGAGRAGSSAVRPGPRGSRSVPAEEGR
jgi:hypothetical protein